MDIKYTHATNEFKCMNDNCGHTFVVVITKKEKLNDAHIACCPFCLHRELFMESFT